MRVGRIVLLFQLSFYLVLNKFFYFNLLCHGIILNLSEYFNIKIQHVHCSKTYKDVTKFVICPCQTTKQVLLQQEKRHAI